jgi:hypothetical protein
MDCDIINQFNQMTMSLNDDDISQEKVYLEKPFKNILKTKFDNNFSDERLNEVKQRLKARQAERDKKTAVTATKLISLDEAVRLNNEEKKQTEVKNLFLNIIFEFVFFFIGTFNSTNNSTITW